MSSKYIPWKDIPVYTDKQVNSMTKPVLISEIKRNGGSGYSNKNVAELKKMLLGLKSKAMEQQENPNMAKQKSKEALDEMMAPDDADISDDAQNRAMIHLLDTDDTNYQQNFEQPDFDGDGDVDDEDIISKETYKKWGATGPDENGMITVLDYEHKIEKDFYFKTQIFYTKNQYSEWFEDEEWGFIQYLIQDIAVYTTKQVKYQRPALGELIDHVYDLSKRRKQQDQQRNPGTDLANESREDFIKIEAAKKAFESLPKNAPAPKATFQNSQMKSQIEIPDIDKKKADLKAKVDKALELGPIDEAYFQDTDWEAFLDDATPAMIQKEVDEIDEVLKILLDAQQEKWIEADFINAQRFRLNTLRKHLTIPIDKSGKKQNFVREAIQNNPKPAGISAAPVGTGQTYSIYPNRKGPQQPDYAQTGPESGFGASFGSPVPQAPPPQNLGRAPSAPPRVFGTPATPTPRAAPPINPGAPVPENLKAEAREYIRKIGEIPITELPANLNDIRNALQQALERDVKAMNDALNKARTYFTKYDRNKNFIPDSREQAGKAIDDALEDTKKIEAERKEKESKKTPLEDLRPDIQKGEERRIRKNFNRDVLELTTANEVLQSQVDIQREEIKVLKESIESKKKSENDSMLSGIAPVFRHFLNLEIDNVVQEETEQVYYTVI